MPNSVRLVKDQWLRVSVQRVQCIKPALWLKCESIARHNCISLALIGVLLGQLNADFIDLAISCGDESIAASHLRQLKPFINYIRIYHLDTFISGYARQFRHYTRTVVILINQSIISRFGGWKAQALLLIMLHGVSKVFLWVQGTVDLKIWLHRKWWTIFLVVYGKFT